MQKSQQKRTNRWQTQARDLGRRRRGGPDGGRSPAAAATRGSSSRRNRGGGSMQRIGAGGWVTAPRRDSAHRFGRNRRGGRVEAKAVGGGRRWGKARGLKCPSRQPLHWDTGHRRGEGETRIFAGWGRDCAAPLKKICGPAVFVGSVQAGFSAPTRILAVILRVWAFCGVC